MEPNTENKEKVFNQVNVYKDIGDKLLKLHKYRRAIPYYDKAVEATTSNKDQAFGGLGTDKDKKDEDSTALIDTIVSRSRAYSRNIDHKNARDDADFVDQKKPNKPSVLLVGGETRFNKDHFEDGLVYYRQGEAIRRKPDYFCRGVLVASEIIEDCIGRNAGDIFDYNNLGETVLQHWIHLNRMDDEPKQQSEQEQTKRGEGNSGKCLAEKYLLGVAHDKNYLQSCLTDRQLYAGDVDAFLKVQDTITDALEKIERQQKSLYRQKPLYTYKMKESMRKISPSLKMRTENEQKKLQLDSAKLVFKLLKITDDARKKLDAKMCLRHAYRTREYILDHPNSILPYKNVYLEHLFKIVGELFFSMKQFVGHWSEKENTVRVLHMIGLIMLKKSEEAIIRSTFSPYIANPRKLLDSCERDLSLSSSLVERAFLYHEMSRCFNQIGKLEQALTMARRCIQEARQARNTVWMVNGMFMVARYECGLRNFVNAKDTINEVYEYVKTMNRPEIQSFIVKAIDFLEVVEEIPQLKASALERREKRMMECMPTEELKKKMSMVFFHMHNAHPSRRMLLVPADPVPVSRRRDSATEGLATMRERMRGRSKIFRRRPRIRHDKK
ncbi:tetratricopeptide repeat protein 25 [Nilaparvata lugens]|uniref:tetratricopeptide repeat protein 25 n=1 Tax=Nilaparvata lugens TaxID=108931 RepID=UPI00193DA804|nr:tetratricopeptide repeat protein 25 [Nilaparvata lugens]